MFGRKTTLTLLTTALVAAGTFGSGAAVWAASAKPTQDGDQIRACAGRHGILRLAFHDHCGRREFPVAWNRQGPAGPPGPAGPGLNPFTPTLQAVQTNSPFAVPTGGAGAIAPVPGLTVTLPAAGTYLINANVRGVLIYPGPVAAGAHGCFIVADLATGGTTMVPNSQRLVVLDLNANTTGPEEVQGTAPIQMLVTVPAPTAVAVRAFANTSGGPGTCPAGTNTGIYTDVNGASTIDAVRIA